MVVNNGVKIDSNMQLDKIRIEKYRPEEVISIYLKIKYKTEWQSKKMQKN